MSTDQQRMQALQLVARSQVTQVATIIGECDLLREHLAAIRAAVADCKPCVHARAGWVELPESAWRELMRAIEGEGSQP